MRELLIATGNPGKVPEIQAGLGNIRFTFLTFADVYIGGSVEEVGQTFEGNALIKAFTYGKRSGKLTLAEDSGIEVDALNGRPGVLSARYAPGTDKDRYEKLLKELDGLPDGERGAQFRAVIAIYDPERADKVRICEGISRGRILGLAKGTNGFGYDPIFQFDETAKTASEMTLEDKNKVSHRGKALAKAKEILLSEFV